MDVHPPHHPVTNWREALTHVGLMTIGLFIALMLEGVVEWAHHKHIVREARENIREELEGNHDAIREDVVHLTENIAQMKANIHTLNDLRAEQQTHTTQHHSLTYNVQYSNLDSAAWTTARDTGALAYMPYREVQAYSGIYDAQEALKRRFDELAHGEFSLLAPTEMGIPFDKLPPGTFDSMLRYTAGSMLDGCTLRQQLEELDGELLKQLGRGEKVNVESCGNLLN